jgi:hypothetical protein
VGRVGAADAGKLSGANFATISISLRRFAQFGHQTQLSFGGADPQACTIRLLTFLCCACAAWWFFFASASLIPLVAWLLAWASAMAMRMMRLNRFHHQTLALVRRSFAQRVTMMFFPHFVGDAFAR